MTRSALNRPRIDPTAIFEFFRGSYGTELLTAAVAHFDIFTRLREQPLSLTDLADAIGIANRPAVVLVTALRAMGLLDKRGDLLQPSELALEHLIPGTEFDVGNYIGLAAAAPEVTAMVESLKTNRPLDSGDGAAFIFRDGMKSAMEATESARHLTLALAGRAKNVAPALAESMPLRGDEQLLDLGGGTGIYTYALMQRHPDLRATVFDRPEVLKVAEEMATEHGLLDRVTLMPGDMFEDDLPVGNDTILLSNILHDWDVPECKQLLRRCHDALSPGGTIQIHDVFLNDEMDGPLPIALYSAALFTLTEGRAYSSAEYRSWLEELGMEVHAPIATMVHCGVMRGIRVQP